MSRPTPFEINVEELFPRLEHAPIVEAVIQFNAPPTVSLEPAELKKKLQSMFGSVKITDQMQLETGFAGSPAGIELRHKSQWDGLRIMSENGKHICQWKSNSLIFSRLAPYQTWESFLGSALPYWEAYQTVHFPEVIESIGVRFISQIELQANQKVSDFVAKVPPPLRGLGLRSDSFFHQDTIPVPGQQYEIRLIRTMQRIADQAGKKSILVVDIDVSTTAAIMSMELKRVLQEIRFLKNKVFFAYMKDAENKFK
jgi:uncharacterized protein (TIGR04255 family)